MSVPDALNHPVRRQILRILIDSGKPHDAREIGAAGLPDLSLSSIGYHARVLESAGMVSRGEGGTAAGDESTYRFAAVAVDDPDVVALLESTRDTDVAG